MRTGADGRAATVLTPRLPLAAYRTKRAAGLLEPDPAQLFAAEKLQSLHNALGRPGNGGRGGWRERLGLARRSEPAMQGLYIFGSVGTGKSMLMDMFFAGAPVAKKRRVHFNAFMLEVHQSLHRWRREASGDPIPPLARSIAEEVRLLCFDEFQVEDIADAMLLGRLFEALFEDGLVVVATTNYAPDDLYKDGLQRENFLPFIALIKERLDILELDGGKDCRRQRIHDLDVYHTPLGREATAALDAAFARLTDLAVPVPTVLAPRAGALEPRGRPRASPMPASRALPRAAGSCRLPGYAGHFHTLILDGVPRLSADQGNEARRFIMLIDELYEHRCHLVIAADALPDRLYPGVDGAFDSRRAASRLIEMQSAEYLAEEHRG